MLIALSGWARSGKDSVAQILVDRYGFRRVAFADKLKQLAAALDPLLPYEVVDPLTQEPVTTTVCLSQLLDVYGPEDAKGIPSVRQFYQRLGEKARDTLGTQVWVDACLADLGYGNQPDVVLSDVRYPNEAAAVRSRLGFLWRIRRPGWGPANDHISERALDDWDFDRTIVNDGSLNQLAVKVAAAIKEP